LASLGSTTWTISVADADGEWAVTDKVRKSRRVEEQKKLP
jgi:hypothetical protein